MLRAVLNKKESEQWIMKDLHEFLESEHGFNIDMPFETNRYYEEIIFTQDGSVKLHRYTHYPLNKNGEAR